MSRTRALVVATVMAVAALVAPAASQAEQPPKDPIAYPLHWQWGG